MPHEYPEKRRFPRIPAEHAVLVKNLGPGELEEFAKTKVMGLGGCMFVSDGPIGVDLPIELLISVRGQVVKAQGRVVWETPTGANRWEVGVEFVSISPADLQVLESLFPRRTTGSGS